MNAPKRYYVFESSPEKLKGRLVGQIEEAVGLRQAAEQATELLLDRTYTKQIAVSGGRGVFVAHGRVGWKRYKRGEKSPEIRFLIEEEKA